jgi:thiamine kinase-like enzyme
MLFIDNDIKKGKRFNPRWGIFINERFDLFINKWKNVLNDNQINIAKNIALNYSNIQNNLSDTNLTLCHGDVKSPNIFYKKIGNSYEPYFIDWQYIANGKGIQDIIFFMIESFEIDKINTYYDIFINYYYTKILENGIKYNYDDYKKDIINSICYFPFFVAIWFETTAEKDLIDKNFPFFFIQKLFNFIEKYVPSNFLFY